ncbi:efflux RND transporter permease subunit [Methylocystis sp. MJC1]|jgi:multidrug efflux pump|uniref:efflux RND transporter permease subunit n=1 Tax=Methylocystis sp. MJC1 TaxID=2654282 RepID=UPI0013EB8694|nr:efflux RND transporter permease subunit [Methylocystis sp. MJC1]KAF2990678.1 Multidrug resistance protein MdtC [Methylocystis sp. MJC1]MBU6528721.1 efflux RND transporter permease subunit [Methylocystis sp. MJC1]UZX11609.1 efflux RND transporter permease subunit [Methylocystis sp. MJC1]
MNVSEPFIRRPVGTTLLGAALFLIGAVAYFFLPVASLPAVDFPAIGIGASRPGADPETMAASVAAPLERRLSGISGLNELTSTSSLGSTQIIAQFDIDKNIDAAARDVQAAINAALVDLPTDLPTAPSFRKASQSTMPVLVLALTSDTLPTSAIFDATDSVIAQRISQVPGVAEARIAGAEQPAIRVQVDSARLAAMNLGVNEVGKALFTANAHAAVGALSGGTQEITFDTTDQLSTPEDYRNIVVASRNGAIVKLGDVARVERGVRNRMSAGWFNGRSAVIIIVTKQPSANVIETVDHIKALLPQLQQWIPAGIKINVLADRTQTIRASIHDIQLTLAISIALVMMVVFFFLRRATPVIAAGITVPLSLVGTCAAMWLAGFSIDNLSLMALTIAVGFVVDDAIVMIENIESYQESGLSRLQAALEGSKQISFTVVSISLSLIAVFIPLLFMEGVMGRLLREFSVTLTFAILISTVVSLTVTPMICAWLPAPKRDHKTRFDRLIENGLDKIVSFYARTLRPVVDHPWITLVVILVSVLWTVQLYRTIPKGNLPQDDIGLINGTSEAAPDVSFEEMVRLQRQVNDALMNDPDVANVGSFIGANSLTASGNQGRVFVALKPISERKSSSREVIDRLRKSFAKIAGVSVFMVPSQDLRSGGRVSKAQYQFTLSDASLDELEEWRVKVLDRLKRLPQLADVTSDKELGGLRAQLIIDRNAASRLNVPIAAIDNALNSAFGQRQDTIIYTQRNQYRVIFETPPSRQRDIRDLAGIYVSSATGTQIPLTAVARVERSSMPLVVNHQGVLPAVTLSYNVAPGSTLDAATAAVEKAVEEMNPPSSLHAGFAGDAADFRKVARGMAALILAALLAVYIILGILYESLVHPITIISTLPSAGLGALLALDVFGVEFTVIAFIGILLLIGIVKKNGIMLVDFALHAERERGLSIHDAALEAAKERFRPILMTTLAAMFGALPLAFAGGIGAELRRPLGITIIGGLLLSQMLTLYSTPVIYLLMSKLRRKRREEAFAHERTAPAE